MLVNYPPGQGRNEADIVTTWLFGVSRWHDMLVGVRGTARGTGSTRRSSYFSAVRPHCVRENLFATRV